jgi:hypothetical protein
MCFYILTFFSVSLHHCYDLSLHLRVAATGNRRRSAKESLVQRPRDGLLRVFGGDTFRFSSGGAQLFTLRATAESF